MSDELIRRDDVLKWACDSDLDLAARKADCQCHPHPPRRDGRADAVLDAAHKYLLEQYGASPLAHPIDRARILAALEPVDAGQKPLRTVALSAPPVRYCPICDIADCATHKPDPSTTPSADPKDRKIKNLRIALKNMTSSNQRWRNAAKGAHRGLNRVAQDGFPPTERGAMERRIIEQRKQIDALLAKAADPLSDPRVKALLDTLSFVANIDTVDWLEVTDARQMARDALRQFGGEA